MGDSDTDPKPRLLNPPEETLTAFPWITVPLADLLSDDMWTYTRTIPIAGSLWRHQLYRLKQGLRPWIATVVPDSSQVHGWRGVGYWLYKGGSEYFVIPGELAPGSMFVEAVQRDRYSKRRGKWTSFVEMQERWLVVERYTDGLRVLHLPVIPPDPDFLVKKALEGIAPSPEEKQLASNIHARVSQILSGLPPHVRRDILLRLASE
jgi:hypothetical protein